MATTVVCPFARSDGSEFEVSIDDLGGETAVLIVHGGGFTGGKRTWDGKLAKQFAADKLTVVRADFSTRSLEKSLIDLDRLSEQLLAKYPTLYLCGVSSGGFLALKLIDRLRGGRFAKLLLICPVTNPAARIAYLRSNRKMAPMAEPQVAYFGGEEQMKKESKYSFYFIPTRIIAGDLDQRIPVSIVRESVPSLLKRSLFVISGRGHELCTELTDRVLLNWATV